MGLYWEVGKGLMVSQDGAFLALQVCPPFLTGLEDAKELPVRSRVPTLCGGQLFGKEGHRPEHPIPAYLR